ncbi:cell wall protein PhiA [Aspergillus glaucus CBS 516.65]|uniref:Cell wall protein PhiA n=1 Tax=Aspergillus glaucus CBS 516.65 TaxID=1160497 RepID=A0A1L9VEI7_ASPGL|nr:hypothetical protein ASPGLDRAFT_37526 [Aspergillus glaucus CBS 516.65]OJJ82232.1 hypothetical protein ASPGLDRAFT_37526 [Aspergillus glaucus CBS 516.65]
MQLKNLILAASAAATVSAAPAEGKPFGVLAIHSGSGVQNSGFNAAKGSLFAGLTSQNASCARPEDGQTATFYIKDSALFLYDQSATPQEFYVDRSGMGQGKIGYTTGAQQPPKNAEQKGWSISEQNYLQFDGSSPIACPNSIDGAYSIWASTGVNNPAGNKDCVGIAARVLESTNPNACKYTE